MTINEFSKVCKEFFAEHDDFKGVIHILTNETNEDADEGHMIGFSGMKGTDSEILGMCLIACDKAGISMREISAVTKRLANDPEAMMALANINRDDDDEENDDESQKKKECCGKCNRKESDKEDSKPSRDEIAKMLVDMLFSD